MSNPFTPPPNVTGSNPFATWHNWNENRHNALRPINTPTVKQRRNSKGIAFNASGGGKGGSSLQLCVITELYGSDVDEAFDYIGVTPWSATLNGGFGNTSGVQFICAKCLGGRGAAFDVIDEQLVIYSQYYNDVQRFAYNSFTQASEYESIHNRYVLYPGFPPPYAYGTYNIIQSFVYVTRCSNPTGVLDMNGNDIFYVEEQPNRNWAYNPQLNGS